MTSIAEALATCTLPRLEARLLLQRALQADATYLAAYPERELSPVETRAFAALVTRRAQGEPIAYILGEREFYGLRLRVDARVLIPRPDTELLVDLALAHVPKDKRVQVLDLGTGSGAIALALAYHRPLAQVTAVDSSAAALALARENAVARLGSGYTERIRFLLGDWYSPLAHERYDLIVSNPPYVAQDDPHLSQGDLRFEPRQALLGGADGLEAVRAIIAGAPKHLSSDGWLMLEHGYDQAERCRDLLVKFGFTRVASQRDLAGIERVSFGGKTDRG